MVNLNEYRKQVSTIREYAKKNGISEEETSQIFTNCLTILKKSKTSKKTCDIIKTIKLIIFIILSSIISLFCLYNHPSTHSIILRNLQNFIYPGLKVFRELSLPIITKYPALTELYDEWCLVENPNFRVSHMDCWPCSTVQSIPDMTGWNMTKTFNIGLPFTRIENDSCVDFSRLMSIYKKQKEIFDEDAGRVSSNSPVYNRIADLMEKRIDKNPSEYQDVHVSWRINRMKPGRILRKAFPRPLGTPKWWSQSTERFLFIDESKSSSYTLPNTECSNIILRCTSGSRLIKMIASPECQKNCKTFSIILSAQQTLWYNWWYWRPLSLPITNTTEISINYLTSYC